MVRPHRFFPNPETADDNVFQVTPAGLAPETVAKAAYAEVTAAVDRLESVGVRVHLFEDDGTSDTPDSVFPNNWFSTHPGGHVAVYPMYSVNRRRERRGDIVEMLKREYRVQDVIDYSGLELDNLFLEGTGAMVFDHIARVAYTARSNRANEVALERFSTHFNFEPLYFDAADPSGQPIYHTNVLMCIATEFALVGFEAMTNPVRAQQVRERLEESGRHVIGLSTQQLLDFAGNAIELSGRDGQVLVLSQRAHDSLRPEQKEIIEESAALVPIALPTIELAGGSARCMIAGVHLSSRGRS